MDNKDKTLGTKDTGRRHTKHKNIREETKKMSNTLVVFLGDCLYVLSFVL
jgi:hypothetical protein